MMKTKNPLVSVLMHNYNNEAYLGEAIESILNQTFKDFELVIVDDGSNDQTLEILTQYSNLNVILRQHKNTATALNRGIEQSSGQWVKLFGSDDIMLPDCLKNFIENVSTANAIYYSDYIVIKRDGSESVYEAPEFPICNQYKELYRKFYGGPPFIHRSLFEKYGLFDESLPYAEDYEWYLKVVGSGVQMIRLPYVTFKFRIHKGQNTNIYGNTLNDEIRSRYANPFSESVTKV